MVKLSSLFVATVCFLATLTPGVSASPKDIIRRPDSKEIAVVAEVTPSNDPRAPLELSTSVVETVNFEELHGRRYLYYLNDYFERQLDSKTESLRVSLWLKGFNFGTQQSKREKAMRLCAFMVRPEVNKTYAGSFAEEEYGAEFALDFFRELCESPLKQIEAFEDCQARLSRSYLPWGRTVRPACDKESEPVK